MTTVNQKKARTMEFLTPKFVILGLLWLFISSAFATMYCNRPSAELGMNPERPYNAVGLMSNGCTAVLIDANHIAAAGHCFVTADGKLQHEQGTGLRFYPNFHPDRVILDQAHVPRADIVRAVVGSRAGGEKLATAVIGVLLVSKIGGTHKVLTRSLQKF